MRTLLAALLLVSVSSSVDGQKRLKDSIYTSLTSYKPCYRRLNGTNQVGCGTTANGQYGVLQLIESAEDLQWIVKEGNHAPYVAVISELNLTESVIRALQQATSRVTGLVVLHNISDSASGAVQSTSELSFDSKCPAARYSLYSNDSEWKDCKSGNWNPPGNSLLFEDMAFPIFLLTSNSEIDSLVSAYRQHNQPKQASDGSRTPPTWPLVSVELTSTMYAFQSSQTCLRRNNLGQRAVLSPQSFCERVAPRSSICTLKPLASANNETSVRANRSVILVATTVDAETPFYAALTGARQLVSLATLFAVADAIGRVKQQITDNNASLDVAFVTFYGEALDRGPSLRFAYDLSGGAGAQAVPSRTAAIRWQHVHSVIELGQLADAEKDGSDYVYYLHWDPLSSRSSQLNQSVNSLLSTLQRAAKLEASNSTFRVAGSDIPLPPSSGQSMLRIASPQPAVVLLSDHRKQFLNRFYQSTLDTLASLNYAPANGSQYSQLTERVASLATSVARTVMATALNCSVDDSRVKQTLATRVEADRLLSCLLVNASCELFRMALDSQIEVPSKPPVFLFSNAISFARAGQSVPTSLLGWYLGERLTNITKADQCTQLSTSRAPYSAVWSRSSYCVVSLAEAMDSMSPAFLIDGYDFGSFDYPAWTESIWPDMFGLRMFMQSSPSYQVIVLLIGVALTLLSGVLSWWIVKNASPVLILSTQMASSPSASSPIIRSAQHDVLRGASAGPDSLQVST